MEMSLNYQVDITNLNDIMTATSDKTNCNPFCQSKVLFKFVEILRDSLAVALAHPGEKNWHH